MASNENSRSTGSAKAPQDPGIVAVRSILIGLRKRSGLSLDRLRRTEIDTTALLQLNVVLRFAHLWRTELEEAATRVVTLAAQELPATDRLIVDAELNLGLLRDDPPAGVDLDELYGPGLSQRCRQLVLRWERLHEALSMTDCPPAPTVRMLRETPEAHAFTALAERLVAGAVPIATPGNTATILGDAVIDQIYVVENMPTDGSSQWGDFRSHPGGKGLNRAVALSRLGVDARLLTAIGDDKDGNRILSYLGEQGVDSTLIKVEAGADTPVTAMITTVNGEYGLIAFKQRRTELAESDLDRTAIRQALIDSRAILLTFEQPTDVVDKALNIALKGAREGRGRPWLILTVAPPQVLPAAVQQHLRQIDYVIGTPGDLLQLWPGRSREDIVDRLLSFGVRAVCVIEDQQCRIHHSPRAESEVYRFTDAGQRSAGAGAAFAAALTYRLMNSDHPAGAEDFRFAAAAIAATTLEVNVPDRMPTLVEIEEFMLRGA